MLTAVSSVCCRGMERREVKRWQTDESAPVGGAKSCRISRRSSFKGKRNRQVLATGFRAWCHKCQIHLLTPCWARCHIPLGYGTGTSQEKNFKPLLTPRGSEGRSGRAAGRREVARTLQRSSAGDPPH